MQRIIQASESEFISLIKQAVREELQAISLNSQQAGKEPLNKKEAAKYLGVSLRTLDTLLSEGALPCFRLGRSVRIRISDIESYVQNKA